MTGMLDDSVIDVMAIMQGIGEVLVKHLGYAPDAVVVLHAPDGQCRTMYAANPETVAEKGQATRRMLTSILEQALKQNRRISDRAPLRQ